MSDMPECDTDRASEQQKIQSRCFHPSKAFIEFKKEEIEQSIAARFEEQAEKHPSRIAVKTKRCELAYDALNQAANRLAHAILAQCGTGQEPIALLFENDAPVICAMLGVLKASKTYVALDPLFPRARIAYVLRDSQADLIVTNSKNLALARELAQQGQQVINVDEISPDFASVNPGLPISPDDIAYITYTSGSTGQPKGIVYNHKSVLLGIRNYTNAFHICADDRLTLLHSCGFSSAMVDIYCALLNGAAVYPWDVKQEGSADLAGWLSQQEITIYDWVPTLYRYFVGALTQEARFPKLRLLVLASEPVSKRDVELYKKHFSRDCILVNRLGTTETYNFRLYFVDRESQISGSLVPAGYAVPDKQVLLLDDAGQEVGFNTVGEIAVASHYLAVGYWRKPELTRAAFRPGPAGGNERIYRTGDLGIMRPDGCLEYLGRKDFQVKIRGYRVELAEIEIALVGLESIREAAVLAEETQTGEKYLVAYIVPAIEPAPAVGELRSVLAKTLPDYMIPSLFIDLQALPLTPTGKVDRRALPTPDTIRPEVENALVPPQDDLQRQLIGIWEQVLGVHPIGIRDNFFELGGHSMLAARLLVQIERAFGQKLAPPALFQSPTVEQLANILCENPQEVKAAWSLLVPMRSTGSKPPFFCIPGNLGNVFTDLGDLAHYLGPDQPFYGLQDSIQNPAQIKALATYYIDKVRSVQREGPYFLGGICSGGIVAFEMARQLAVQAQKVALLALVEPVFPWNPGLRSCLDFASHVFSRFARRLTHHSRNVSQLGGAEQKIFFRLKMKLVANLWALRCYAPKPYTGRIHLFLTQESSAKAPRSFQVDWDELAVGGVERHAIPGTHNAITGDNDATVEREYMQALAKQLEVCIDNALEGT